MQEKTKRPYLNILFYPGTFDPFTKGHLDVLNRACNLADKVVIGVLFNFKKEPLFSLDERTNIIQTILQEEGLANKVDVQSFSCLTVDFMRQNGIKTILRGIRLLSDFEAEMHLALNNKNLYPQAETIFLFTSHQYSHISSSAVREIYYLNGDISTYIHPSTTVFFKNKPKKLNKNSE